MAEHTREPPDAPEDRDPNAGTVDFTRYSTEQLVELRAAFDPARFPKEHAEIERALALRAATPTSSDTPIPEFRADVRLTSRDGILGWLQAKMAGNQLFGSGAVSLHTDRLVVAGWSRTWLGVAQQSELVFTLSEIDQVVTDGDLVCFSSLHGRRRRTLTLRAVDNAQAAALAARLPQPQDPGLDENWAEFQAFNRAVLAATPHTQVTTALVAINLLIFLGLFGLSFGPLRDHAAQFQAWGVNLGTLTLNGEWWRLVTALFLHANLPHLALNLLVLWNVGRHCERLFGRATFLVLYLLCGIAASMSSIVWDANRFTIGASGAIFGLFGAFLAILTFSHMRVPGQFVRAHLWSTVIFIAVNLVAGAFSYIVDNAAHVGGLVAGFLLGCLLASGTGSAEVGKFRITRVGVAVTVTLVMLIFGNWIARDGSAGTPDSYRWLQSHRWYLDQEPANLNAWLELDQEIVSGTVSRQVAARRFADDVLPFWVTANQRLLEESQAGTPDPMSVQLAKFVAARLDWANEWLTELKGKGAREDNKLEDLMRATSVAQARFIYRSTRVGLADRPYSLSDAPWVARLRAAVDFKNPDCVRNRNALSQPTGAEDSPTDGPARRYAAGCSAQAAFRSAAYDDLDSQLTRHATHLADLEDGSSSFSGDVSGLEDYFEYSGVPAAHLLVGLSNWRRAVPESPYPDLFEASLFQTMAWQVRGGGYADTVSNEQWQEFSMRLEMAAAALEDAELRGRQTPLWYTLAIDTGLDRSVDPGRLREIFDAGVEKFPGFEQLYRSTLRTLMPRWGGSFESVESFIQAVADREQLWTPDARYANLHMQFADLEGDETDVFSDVGADRRRLVRGFEELVRKFPRSNVILNSQLNFACRARDFRLYGLLRPVIEGRHADSVWTRSVSLDTCDEEFRAWSAGPTGVASGSEHAADAPRPDRTTNTLWGIRLGMSRIEVERAKGVPVKVDGTFAYYDAGGPGDNAVIQIAYGRAPRASEQPVRAVFYLGDREHAPEELPFIGGMTRGQLDARFGLPIWQSERTGGGQNLDFAGGIAVNLWEDEVMEYGIHDGRSSP